MCVLNAEPRSQININLKQTPVCTQGIEKIQYELRFALSENTSQIAVWRETVTLKNQFHQFCKSYPGGYYKSINPFLLAIT